MTYELNFEDLKKMLMEVEIDINIFGIDIVEDMTSNIELSTDFLKKTTVNISEFTQHTEKTTAQILKGSSFLNFFVKP